MNKEELVKKITLANEAYARGYPFMTDTDYDLLWAQLYTIEPNHSCLYHTANYPDVNAKLHPHSYPVRGTLKAFNTEDLKPFMARFGHTNLILQPKYDGCAVMLYKQANNSFKLILEGNGLEGRDITHHLNNFFIPLDLSASNSMEAIIHNNDWDSDFGANPRNVIAGWINRDKFPDHRVHLVNHNNGALEQEYFFDGNYDSLSELLLTLFHKWSTSYPLDGIMIKVQDQDLRLRAGDNGSVYNWSIAWKPPISTATTTVTDIEWNVSRRGRVVPTIIYEPIELCGTTNRRVNGVSAEWVSRKRIAIGTTIIIGKAGEIIPKLIEVKDNKIFPERPTSCPICSTLLEPKGDDLFCYGPKCLPQLTKSLEYFYSDKGMELKFIGAKLFQDLLENHILYKVLSDHPYALLDLDAYNIRDIVRRIFGPIIYEKYKNSLRDIQGKKTIINFITALGKDGLGYKNTTNLYHYLKGQPLRRNVSNEIIDSFVNCLTSFNTESKVMTSFSFSSPPAPPVMTYCITGILNTDRGDMIKYLSGYRWEFSPQVSKYVDLLIVGEKPGKTKVNKAEYISCTMITEDELTNYINKE